MLSPRQVSLFSSSSFALGIVLMFLAASCTLPKNFQKNKPFVFKTEINVEGDIRGTQKQSLKSGLANQLADSLKVRTIVALGFPTLLYNKLNRPPVFDSLNISRSKTSMNALLNSKGYFGPTITDTFLIDTVRDQQRVKVIFNVQTGTQLKLDSIGYDIAHPEFQELALANRDKSVLKKGDPYSIQTLSAELDRLLLIYRNHGYYKIVKEDFIVERDTVLAALIDPSLDPFEQFELLEELRRKRDNPTINVVIKQAPVSDSTHREKFYIGEVKVYPDMTIQEEITPVEKQRDSLDGILFFYRTKRFKLPYLSRNVSLRPGTLYKIDNYFATINAFNQSGAWGQVDVGFAERRDSVRLLDPTIRLFPAKRQSLTADFEASRNAGDYLTTGQLFGIGVNFGLLNRNAFREAIQSGTNLRFGIEFGRNLIQTLQASITQNIYIPRFILPFKVRNEAKLNSPRTVINVGASYTSRKEFFNVRSINTSWGYEWRKDRQTWRYIPFNIEYTDISKTQRFRDLEDEVPALRIAFNNGLIIGQVLSYNLAHGSENKLGLFKVQLEESGAIFGNIRSLDEGSLQRFVKGDIEYKYLITQAKSAWAFRVFGGYGYSYGRTATGFEQVMPFFKAYFAGGPYSMRAWQVRQLGLGSNNFFNTQNVNERPLDRFGDVKLESNVEYRFNLGTVFGVKLRSAFFVDIGNVWSRTDFEDPDFEGSQFRISNLYKDLAVGGGTSLRLDFDFFLIRLDWAYKLKDPVFSFKDAGWLNDLRITNGQLQFGIGYPF